MNKDSRLIFEAYTGFTGVETDKDGTNFWYVNGKRHRDGGLPAVEWADGTREWYVNDKLIRSEGPVYTALRELGIDL